MTTLLEAAQAVVNASKEYTPTWIHWAIKDRINALEQVIAQEKATHKPVSSRETWKCSRTWKCDNCGKGITLHEGQRYCHTKEMT